MSGVRWADYNDAQVTRAVRPLAARLIERAGDGRGRPALDLGCGAGVETRALAAAGWHVSAVDSDPSMPQRLADLVARGEVDPVVGDLREVSLGPAALVHSSLAVPFVPRSDFALLWDRLVGWLQPGGWLGIDLFGDRDDWCGTEELNFHDRGAVEALLSHLVDVEVLEEERDAPSFNGAVKHWHVFHVIARRPDESRAG